MLEGETVLALAWAEPGRRFDLEPTSVQATSTSAGWRLNGRKSTVIAAPVADQLIVSAATSQGPTLFLVPSDAKGLRLTQYRLIDGQRAADVVFGDVEVDGGAIVGTAGEGLAPLNAALDCGAAGACADAIGAMGAALALTAEYVQTRKQFGQAIGSFQVIQHRLAKMAMELEYAKSLLPLLGARLQCEPDLRSRTVSAVRVKISSAARYVVADAVQLHGGIGVTEEAAVSHYFRRVTAHDLAWGGSRYHLERYRAGRQPGRDLLLA